MKQLYYHLFPYLAFLFIGCSSNENIKSVPEKNKSIPDNAFWSGGMDGGNWYLIDSIDQFKKEAKIIVYNEYDGKIIIEKLFKLNCKSDEDIDWNNLNKQFSAFDGEKIFLHKTNSTAQIKCFFE